MLRDNIAWEVIGDELSTRSNVLCCQKWYNQLIIYEDVDWDNLVEHRSGDVCRKRWDQLVKHIGEHANMSFAEQVEVLSKRYCTDLLEAREAYDSKPAVS
ncbi:hypothetical protein ACB092_11G099000 [Castanea dentata]